LAHAIGQKQDEVEARYFDMQKVANLGSMQIVKFGNGPFIAVWNSDSAMSVPERSQERTLEGNTGGIDLNAVDAGLKVNATGQAVRFNIDPAMFEQYKNAAGFVPVILNVQPFRDAPAFFGLSATDDTSTIFSTS
jgi:hypothetical protein